MTAEIAILNRLACVLAADSAVTVRVGQQEKVYNTADKIFEICRDQPFGLMIYNTLDFMGVPWEVLIRKFRTENGKRYRNVHELYKKFVEFISKDYPTDEERSRYFRQFAQSSMNKIFDSYLHKLRNPSNDAVGPEMSPAEGFKAHLREQLEALQSFAETESMAHVDFDMFDADYGGIVAEVVPNSFLVGVDDETLEISKQIIFRLVKSDYASELVTGLVFAGFGQGELFPSMVCIEIDGFYFGKPKIMVREHVDIDRTGVRAAVIPFAQREMVDRFLSGIDAELQTEIERFVGDTTGQAVQQIIDALPLDHAAKAKAKKDFVGSIARESQRSIAEDLFGPTKQRYVQDINDMVMFMPKPEMVNLAESLVNFTSIKRRVSLESETVGGPVDVAVISNSEGFVWVRRKHYFPADRNPRYFDRKTRASKGGKK